VVSASCNLNVAFTPSSVAVGPRSASIAIADDAPGSPQIIPIAGLAQTAPDPITAPGSVLTFTGALVQVVKAGQTASYHLQLMPGFTGTLTFQCAGAPLAATCYVPPSMSVTSGTPLPLAVTISTTGAGAELILQPSHWFPSLEEAGRVLCFLITLIIVVCAIGWCDHDTVVRGLSPLPALAACLLIVAVPLAGCDGGTTTAQSAPVTQSLAPQALLRSSSNRLESRQMANQLALSSRSS
jgi:hypothetical protein